MNKTLDEAYAHAVDLLKDPNTHSVNIEFILMGKRMTARVQRPALSDDLPEILDMKVKVEAKFYSYHDGVKIPDDTINEWILGVLRLLCKGESYASYASGDTFVVGVKLENHLKIVVATSDGYSDLVLFPRCDGKYDMLFFPYKRPE